MLFVIQKKFGVGPDAAAAAADVTISIDFDWKVVRSHLTAVELAPSLSNITPELLATRIEDLEALHGLMMKTKLTLDEVTRASSPVGYLWAWALTLTAAARTLVAREKQTALLDEASLEHRKAEEDADRARLAHDAAVQTETKAVAASEELLASLTRARVDGAAAAERANAARDAAEKALQRANEVEETMETSYSAEGFEQLTAEKDACSKRETTCRAQYEERNKARVDAEQKVSDLTAKDKALLAEEEMPDEIVAIISTLDRRKMAEVKKVM